MRTFPKQFFVPTLFLLLLTITLWKFPFVMPLLSVFFVCFSLVISISSIIKKHKQSANPSLKIARDILTLIFILLLAMLLGGLVGMYANQYASQQFGMMAGILSALVASFTVGYLVKWGVGKAVRAD